MGGWVESPHRVRMSRKGSPGSRTSQPRARALGLGNQQRVLHAWKSQGQKPVCRRGGDGALGSGQTRGAAGAFRHTGWGTRLLKTRVNLLFLGLNSLGTSPTEC